MFLACDEFVLATVKGTSGEFDARGIMNFCHIEL